MSLNLSGVLDNYTIETVVTMMRTRFKNHDIFKTPESLILYEQKYLDDETLFKVCNAMYEEELSEPTGSYVLSDIKEELKGSRLVPMQVVKETRDVIAVYIPEYGYDTTVKLSLYNIKYVPTTLHHYIKHYTRVYGLFPELLEIPGKYALDMILREAIKHKAPDLTITSRENSIIVYYNKNKKRIPSNNIFPGKLMEEMIMTLTIKSPITSFKENKVKYVGIDIDSEFRGRVVINKTYHGHAITIRLFSKFAFNHTYEDLNLNEEYIKFLEDNEKQKHNGLRLIVGETMSGKNTTALSILRNIVVKGDAKVVSIEMPIEQTIDGVEQISAEFIEEYTSNIESLIHQNPDFVYVAETKDETGMAVIKIANTGKRVLTTLHSNNVSGTISRLVDITGLTANRIIQVLHSITFQELIRDDVNDKVYPSNTFVYFDEEFKQELYDKDFGHIIKRIKERERGGLRGGLLQRK